MADKNHRGGPDGGAAPARGGPFWRGAASMVLYTEPFDKIEFLDGLAGSAGGPVVYVDTDLLYTGYVRSGMIRGRDGTTIYNPDRRGWNGMLAGITARASRGGEGLVVVIDSFNGVSAMFGDDLAAARLANACVMLLSYAGCGTGGRGGPAPSSVIITAMARRRRPRGAGGQDGARAGRWALSPGGRQIIRAEGVGTYVLERAGGGLAARRLKPAGGAGAARPAGGKTVL